MVPPEDNTRNFPAPPPHQAPEREETNLLSKENTNDFSPRARQKKRLFSSRKEQDNVFSPQRRKKPFSPRSRERKRVFCPKKQQFLHVSEAVQLHLKSSY
mmetsp:Transcript_11402/g.19915  ORF Transcript_11402/g.19915 Transcript_11402/m.19915 type:complete len:100 (-) Transcript_11402:1358-1657(-)